MPQVTDITQQQKRIDRYSIYLDGKYTLSLGELELATSGLRVGAQLSDNEVEQLQSQSLLGKALDRAYNYLSYRPRTTKEIGDYLRGKDYDDQLIQQVLDKLQQQKYLDDEQFSRTWVLERQGSASRSKRMLEQELRKKGIDPDTIARVLSEHTSDDEVQSIMAIVEAKRLAQRYDSREKLIRYLAGQGFSYHNIKRALDGPVSD